MRRNRIICILCLSCILIVIHVNSQTNCPAGWFGSHCNYKCRCVNAQCDKTGQCIAPSTCQGGWFGPECQYADMAHTTDGSSVLTDGNDITCVAPTDPDTVTISMNESIVFTWLRVCVSNPGSADLANLSVTFSRGSSQVNCSDLKKVAVDNTTLDVHCNLTEKIDDVILIGAAVKSLCSVSVSGGRNVALKETAHQDSTYKDEYVQIPYTYPAWHAVDGDVRNRHVEHSCARSENTVTWTLILSQTRTVHRYKVYNRGDYYQKRMKGFILESFDSMNSSQFKYQDTSSTVLMIYEYNHLPLPVKMVAVTVTNNENFFEICEVEVYGDSLCDNEHYGRDCELRCQCFHKAPCLVSTGLCPDGCAEGYHGHRCLTECSPGQFGSDCRQTCSANCAELDNSTMASCNHVTGVCFAGCKIGFTGALCDSACVMTFGQDCDHTCNLTCEQPVNSNLSSCDSITGVCLTGCEPGHSGTFCETECAVGVFGKDCKSECSKNCQDSDNAEESACDPVTGACFKGCKDGSSGELCDSACTAGTFGKDCKSECSQNCQAFGNAENATCDTVTGACLKGCKGGSSGERCGSTAPETSDKDFSLEAVIATCFAFATGFAVFFCLRKKKRTRFPSEEATVRRVT